MNIVSGNMAGAFSGFLSHMAWMEIADNPDNGMQLMTAIEDFEYTKWLDPDGVPCYLKDDDEIADY